MPQASSAFRWTSIAGMLLFGTCTVVIQKVIFNLPGKGRKGDTHVFKKPWFQTEAMFIGMFGCLFVYEGMNLYKYLKRRNSPEGQRLLDDTKPSVNASASGAKKAPPKWKQYVLVIAPAMCDMVATSAMNIGLVWISASVWQMLRGSMVIFSALFSKFFLKRELHASHWIGVGTVAFALLVVAFSALMPSLDAPSESNSDDFQATTSQQAIGCTLVVVAQVIQASQIVVEEFLLHEVDLHAVLIVGLEGLWGGLACSLLLVVVNFIPEPYGEDVLDTLYMLTHNGKIIGTGLAYAAAILAYNMFGMFVTQTTSAVIRTILEGLRTACIWITNLFIHYVVTKDPKFGEAWTQWSYLQLCGFLFLLLGMWVYNGIVRIDGLYYAPKPLPKKPEETTQA